MEMNFENKVERANILTPVIERGERPTIASKYILDTIIIKENENENIINDRIDTHQAVKMNKYL